jgi:glycosyltransferase involved in cell wall biosynthesis
MLPRLLYVGDVPVEASYHGSALLHRLLSNYPVERLMILETGAPSEPSRRLPHVKYTTHQIGKQRWLNTRFHPYAVAWFTHAGKRAGPKISQSINGFEVESVFTVAHGFGWIAAAEIAKQRRVPLHLAVHDDWPRVADIAPRFRNRIDEQFGDIYRRARSRLCVSPAMGRFYEDRYGAPANVIYPSRAAQAIEFENPPARIANNNNQFTVAFAGTINSQGYVHALQALQNVLKAVNGRLLVFGPLTAAAAEQMGLNDPNTKICGLLSSEQLLARLREEADALFVPMSFADGDRINMKMAFPSKLADYTATGLPLLIYGPAYCSAVAWARDNPGVAEVVESESSLGGAVASLAGDPEHRLALGTRVLEVGRQYFSHARVQQVFHQLLSI